MVMTDIGILNGLMINSEVIMKIVFYRESNGEVLHNTNDQYFVMNDIVFRDNEKTFESQCAVVAFEDFIRACPEVGWMVEHE